MNITPSLLDPPANSPFMAAADWVTGTLLGSLAVSLCVIAIAFVGLMLMSGRLAIRDGVRVVVACFVLLGASTIAAGLRSAADETLSTGVTEPVQAEVFPEPSSLPPANYDPYAGASLRRN